MKTIYNIVTLPYLVLFTAVCLLLFVPPAVMMMMRDKHEEKETDENGEEKTTVFINTSMQSLFDWLSQQPLMKLASKIPKEAKAIFSLFIWYLVIR